MKYQLLFLYF